MKICFHMERMWKGVPYSGLLVLINFVSFSNCLYILKTEKFERYLETASLLFVNSN